MTIQQTENKKVVHGYKTAKLTFVKKENYEITSNNK